MSGYIEIDTIMGFAKELADLDIAQVIEEHNVINPSMTEYEHLLLITETLNSVGKKLINHINLQKNYDYILESEQRHNRAGWGISNDFGAENEDERIMKGED